MGTTRGLARRLLSALPARASRVRSELPMMVLDAALIGLSFIAMLLYRDEWVVPEETWQQALIFLPIMIATYLVIGWIYGIYHQVWRYASVQEAKRLLGTGTVAAAALTTMDIGLHLEFGPLTVIASVGLATLLMGAVRFQSRLFARRRLEADTRSGLRVIVVGAGETGAALVRQMQDSRSSGLVPVAFIDDDPRMRGKHILGIPVLGDTHELSDVVMATTAQQVLLAVASAPRDLVQRVVSGAEGAGVALRIVPSIEEIVRSGLRLQDMREVRIDDLLGRDQVVTDLAAVAALLDGKRVLITGAGGSIGAEISRQVAALSPAALLLLDHDETHLHDVIGSLATPATPLLVDIRERDRILRTFERVRPEVVFHAAAHKHVPLLEDCAGEAVRTNIVGTQHVVDAATAVGVGTFVLISTDKAVRPSSVMGASKRIAEQVVVRAAGDGDRRWTAVRFGNVLGSRGSVIPTFVRQIESGGPVTVTDPRMTRYFMSIPEAVQLVLQAAALSEGGEVFMLEMGEPVRIIDLAQRMIRLSGRRVGTDIEIRVTGIRPGEKLEEQLHAVDENPHPTAHPSITRLEPTALSPQVLDAAIDALGQLAEADEDQPARELLLDLASCPAEWVGTVEGAADISGDLVDLRGPHAVRWRLVEQRHPEETVDGRPHGADSSPAEPDEAKEDRWSHSTS